MSWGSTCTSSRALETSIPTYTGDEAADMESLPRKRELPRLFAETLLRLFGFGPHRTPCRRRSGLDSAINLRPGVGRSVVGCWLSAASLRSAAEKPAASISSSMDSVINVRGVGSLRVSGDPIKDSRPLCFLQRLAGGGVADIRRLLRRRAAADHATDHDHSNQTRLHI